MSWLQETGKITTKTEKPHTAVARLTTKKAARQFAWLLVDSVKTVPQQLGTGEEHAAIQNTVEPHGTDAPCQAHANPHTYWRER